MPTVNQKTIVGVIGASTATGEVCEIAEAVGLAIGEKGWHLLSGGGGGVMEAAGRGFLRAPEENRGVSLGILPGDDAAFANDYVEIPLPTGMGYARNALIARSASALIAISGCAGTLSEIAYGWQFERPIVAMTSSGGWSTKLAGTLIDDRLAEPIYAADNPADAISYIEKRLEATQK